MAATLPTKTALERWRWPYGHGGGNSDSLGGYDLGCGVPVGVDHDGGNLGCLVGVNLDGGNLAVNGGLSAVDLDDDGLGGDNFVLGGEDDDSRGGSDLVGVDLDRGDRDGDGLGGKDHLVNNSLDNSDLGGGSNGLGRP